MDFISLIIDFILHIDRHLVELVNNYHAWVYLILAIIIFCETGLIVTPFLPGDSLLFTASALAALPNSALNIYALASLLILAAILGDAVNYLIGKYLGRRLFSRANSKIFKQRYLAKTHKFYEKYGGKTIILARFIPIIRTFAPFVAGMGNMNYRHFFFFNVVGAISWVGLFSSAGYLFGNNPFIQTHLHWLILLIIAISLLPIAIEILKLAFKKKATS